MARRMFVRLSSGSQFKPGRDLEGISKIGGYSSAGKKDPTSSYPQPATDNRAIRTLVVRPASYRVGEELPVKSGSSGFRRLTGAIMVVASLLLGAMIAGAAAQNIVPGSAKKVCQVVGEFDRERGVPTVNQTETRFGLVGTDLGSSFEFEDQLWVLFGDSIPTATFNGRNNLSFRDSNYNDSIAYTQIEDDPSGCIRLQFNTGPNGAYASPVIHSTTTL